MLHVLWDTDHFSAVGFLQHLLQWGVVWGTLIQKMVAMRKAGSHQKHLQNSQQGKQSCKG